MSEISKTKVAVTKASADADCKIQLSEGKKRLIVEALRSNFSNVYIAVSYERTGASPTDFSPLCPSEAKFYSAPKGKKIYFLWLYCQTATQYVNYEASNGSLSRPPSHDPSDIALIQDVKEGFVFVERWENGFFDRRKYIGRIGAFFKSEAAEKERNLWTTPLFSSGTNTLEVAPWNNSLQMRNSVDGIAADEVYFAILQAFKRVRMRFDAKLPTIAQLAATDHIFIGFETPAAGGHAIICLHGTNGKWYLEFTRLGKTGVTGDSLEIQASLPNLGAFSEYIFEIDPPFVTLYEQTGGSWYVRGTVESKGDISTEEWFVPFFANESTGIDNNFYLGQIQIWRVESAPVLKKTTTVNPAANPTCTLFVANRPNIQVFASSIITTKTLLVQGSNDGSSWRDIEELVTTALNSLFQITKNYPAFPYKYMKLTLEETGTGTSIIEIAAGAVVS